MKNTALYFLMVLLPTVLSGCKMSYSFTGASIPAEAKTISVQYFANNAPLAPPTYSQTFTESLRTLLMSQTSLSMVPKNGDLSFSGFITNYSTAPSGIQSNDKAATNRLSISVTVKFSNRFDESKNFESGFTKFKDYPSSQSLAEVESGLIKDINDQLVQEVFNKALNNW